MVNVSEKIIKEYKSANVIGMAIRNKTLAALARIGTLILFILAIKLFFLSQENNPIYSSIMMLLLMVALGFSYDLLVKYILKKKNINWENLKLSPQDIARIMLKEILITNGMYSTGGVEYLLRIYTRKGHIVNTPWIAMVGIFFSPIISNIINGLMSERDRQNYFNLMVSTKEIMDVNLVPIISVITALIILFALLIYVYRNTKALIQIIFGFGYTAILYDLEYILLPEIIRFEGELTSSKEMRNRRAAIKKRYRSTFGHVARPRLRKR